jgi:hypothetical protein
MVEFLLRDIFEVSCNRDSSTNSSQRQDVAENIILHPAWLSFEKFLKSDAPQSLVNAGFVRNLLLRDSEKLFRHEVI